MVPAFSVVTLAVGVVKDRPGGDVAEKCPTNSVGEVLPE